MTDGEIIRNELEAAAAARHEQQSLQRRIDEAERRVDVLRKDVAALRSRLADESADVERLESFSPTRIWAAMKGSHAGDLERETAERDAARYAVAETEARLQVAETDLAGLRARLDDLGDVDNQYAAALRDKEEWLATGDPALAARLADLAEQRGDLVGQDRENREAWEAGCAARDHLDQASQLLGSAQSWSTWDTFGGGGMLTDMMKYDKLDAATQVLRRADQALRAFARELADVGLAGVPSVPIDGMTRTFDVFFDNIFSDMAVRSRIQQTCDHVSRASHAVAQALGAVQQTARDLADRTSALDEERERLLLTGGPGAAGATGLPGA